MKHSMVHLSHTVIDTFIEKANNDEAFTKLLTASLLKAKEVAHQELKPALFKVLEWPITLAEYHQYLITFSKWTPQETKEAVWLIPGGNGHQQVDDRLNHFYWLIDQEVGGEKKSLVENINWFSKWLIEYAQSWGSYLETTDSFNQTASLVSCGVHLENVIKY